MENSPTRNCEKYHPDVSDIALIVWTLLVSIGLIVVSIAFGVGIDPNVSMFASP
jgi:hypothetical protein